IYRDREYYLVECKWVAEPVEAAVIRELKGKLDNRVDVRGIVISMSGFTSGAVVQSVEYTGQRVIILFGPEDVRALMGQENTFEVLLNEKYKALVTRKQVVWQ
ncbi:MAG: restriction endonuclease, partial [Actinobacteria bacterium]|nr:restriction endonuclease [Actinomycetota bacterium]